MSNVRRSFVHVFTNKNWMMLLAFVVGLALQLLVVEVPIFNDFFSTHNFDLFEWIIACCLAVVPLVIHEISVFFMWLGRKIKKA